MNDFNVITFHTAYNHGAVLQTLGLQELITQQGFSAAIYDYQPPQGKMAGMKGKAVSLLRKMDAQAYDQKERNFQNFVGRYLDLTKDKACRTFISGSDQVWNPTGSMNPMFFLQFVGNDCLRASYAASMGNTKIPPEKLDTFQKYIRSFDAVSVREEAVKEVISDFYPGEINVHVDPTLVHSKEFWRQYEEPVEKIPEKYTLVYILHLAKNTNELLKWLKKETGNDIVLIDGQGMMSFLVNNDHAIHFAGPAQFLWLIDHAQNVVTTSFHGTAFSLIFQKEFYSIVNPAMPSRINNLLSLVGLTPISEDMHSFVRNTNVDWSHVEAVLNGEREKSAAYIRKLYDLAGKLVREPLKGTVDLMKDNCTGCAACEAVCPVSAISMILNKEGFYEPKINGEKCVNCSKCLRQCPQNLHISNERKAAWYGWHNDKTVRFESSSGGVMRALADSVLAQNGAVYGAVYDDDYRIVRFDSTDNVDIKQLQKSKYTVSNPEGVYKRVKHDLETGRKVMFAGTPCQCAGLTSYLGKEYDNLLRCDFVCGGMSSLIFYQEHLRELEKRFDSKIATFGFRPKDKGWGTYYIKAEFTNGKIYMARGYQDSYISCFANQHVSVREACLKCRYTGEHASDITFADFWGKKSAGVKGNAEGLSLITANTEKGLSSVASAENLLAHPLEMKYSDYAFRYKGPNFKKLEEQAMFYKTVREMGSYEDAARKLYPGGEWAHIKNYLKLRLHLK